MDVSSLDESGEAASLLRSTADSGFVGRGLEGGGISGEAG